MYRYFSPNNGKVQQFRFTVSFYLYPNFRSFGSTQTFHDIGCLHLDSGYHRIIYLYNTITCYQAYFFRRTTRYYLNHIDCIGQNIKLNTDSVEVAFQRFSHLFRFFRICIGRMRIQFFQHTYNGIFYQFTFIGWIHIQVGYCIQSHL